MGGIDPPRKSRGVISHSTTVFYRAGHGHGCQILPRIGPDWHKMGQMCDFLRSIMFRKLILKSPSKIRDFLRSLFCLEKISVQKNDLKNSQICPIWYQSGPILNQM